MAPIIYRELFKTFRFLVEVEWSGNKTVAAFAKFSGIKMHVDTVQVRTGADKRGVQEHIPGITHYENVTLTKGVIGDNEFLDWILSVAPGSIESPTGKEMYRTINIAALNEENTRGVTWSLINAIPVAYELQPMDGSESGVMSESIEFAIGGFKRQTDRPKNEKLLEDKSKSGPPK